MLFRLLLNFIMGTLSKILLLVFAIFLIWQMFGYVKNHPEVFSAQNLNKSFFNLGILALILIAFIALLVVIAKHL